MLTNMLRVAAIATTVTVGVTSAAVAQTTAADPHHPDTTLAQASPSSEPKDMAAQGQGAPPGQAGMMSPCMMGGMMQPGMMGGMMQPGMMGEMPMMGGKMHSNMMQPGMTGGMPMMGMRGRMMKIMFTISDADGDGRLSFEEVTIIHKRIFDKVDADKDGKVAPEELQAFMRE